MAPASELASDLVNQVPILTRRLHKYDEQNFQLQLRHDNLEEQIDRVRRSIAHKKSQQVRFADELESKGGLKRQRTEDDEEPESRILRARTEGPSTRAPQNFDLRTDSELPMGVKRKGRLFLDEEMRSSGTNF